jgi:hypothetical protein
VNGNNSFIGAHPRRDTVYPSGKPSRITNVSLIV